jgi:LemA protein
MDRQLVVLTLEVIALLALVLYVVTVYNSLVSVRREVSRAWANIDVLLKQRFDELPKLVEVCKAYMKYEQETLERVVSARAAFGQATSVESKAEATAESASVLRQLFAVAERYPELKADSQFAHLRERISQLETRIADRRETYNDVVNTHNVRIAQLPDMLLARPMGYGSLPLFEAKPGEQQASSLGLGETGR